MTLRTRFLITALILCHQLLAAGLVTSQLHSESDQGAPASGQADGEKTAVEAASPCPNRAVTQLNDGTLICAIQQEKQGDVYKLRGDAEIHYRTYILRADEITYDSNSGEATASGHVTLDGGPNDDHVKASHGTYNLTAETGRFYNVRATTGLRLKGNRLILTSTAPFAFTGKRVDKTSPEHYVVYDGTITTCELPHPHWIFQARKVVVDVGGNASIYHSDFLLEGIPIFYFPFASHPVTREARHTGFLIPTAGNSNTNGYIVGDSFYWAINRSLDATIAADYFSMRGWSQRGQFRARPSDTSYVDLTYFGVIDRGIGFPPQKQGGEEARLNAEGELGHYFRGVANVDYLSSFIFRIAFSEVYSQAVDSEVKSQLFLTNNTKGFDSNLLLERYQYFEVCNTFNAAGQATCDTGPQTELVHILHTPSFMFTGVERQLGDTPLYWSFDSAA